MNLTEFLIQAVASLIAIITFLIVLNVQRSMLISSLKVEPQIPIFITYFTIYPDVNGKLQYFSDVYGYDKVIFDVLKSFGVKSVYIPI